MSGEPCFGGTPSATYLTDSDIAYSSFVAILVLVEHLLLRSAQNPVIPFLFCCNPCFGGTPSATAGRAHQYTREDRCNPCFGGTPSATPIFGYLLCLFRISCNPCFGGTPSATVAAGRIYDVLSSVAILVLVEHLLLRALW